MSVSCRCDSDCQTQNARCYPTLPRDQVSDDQVAFNNSLFCYCEQWSAWIGRDCADLSPTTILMATSALCVGFIALVLGLILLADIFRMVHPIIVSTLSTSRTTTRSATTVTGGGTDGVAVAVKPTLARKRRANDLQLTTSVLLSLALLFLSGWMITDATRLFRRVSCTASDGTRVSCLITLNNVFVCSVPILGTPLILLLSVMVYNASFRRSSALSSLPFTSFWSLVFIDTCLFAALIVSVVVNDYAIASYAGAAMAFLAALINAMSCNRLRDFSVICKLILMCKPKAATNAPRMRWLIKQRLMVISLVVGILNTVIIACLIVRGIANDEVDVRLIQGRYAEISEHIFRWAYVGILAVYHTLIHHNARTRLSRRRSTGEIEQEQQERTDNEAVNERPRSSSNNTAVVVPVAPPKKPSKTVTFALTPPLSVAPPSRTSTSGADDEDEHDDNNDAATAHNHVLDEFEVSNQEDPTQTCGDPGERPEEVTIV